MAIKFFYPSPMFLPIGLENIASFPQTISILAVTPEKEIVLVRELLFTSLWKEYWLAAQKTTNFKGIKIQADPKAMNISLNILKERISEAISYIIAKGYLFLGILYTDSNVFDVSILREGVGSKEKFATIVDIFPKYRLVQVFPSIIDQKYVNAEFLGRGEKYFQFDQLIIPQIAKMLDYFHGSFYGVIGNYNNQLNFVLLSKNITEKEVIGKPVVDKDGRDLLLDMIKNKNFIPACGFRLDFGPWALNNIKQWKLMANKNDFIPILEYFQNYRIGKTKDKPFSFEIAEFTETIPLFEVNIKFKKKSSELKEVNADQFAKDVEQNHSTPQLTHSVPESQRIQLKPITLTKIAPTPKEPISSTPELRHLKKSKRIQKMSEELEYVDELNPSNSAGEAERQTQEILTQGGSVIMDADHINTKLFDKTMEVMDSESGTEIDISKLDKAQFLHDLKTTDETLTILQQKAKTSEFISRVYRPPPLLYAFTDTKAMETGISSYFLTIGTGRNLWMFPEIVNVQSWEHEGKEVIQIEEIDNKAKLEKIFQDGFAHIKKFNLLFLGTIYLENNGFSEASLEECPVDRANIKRLQAIHEDRRESMKFPKLSDAEHIEVRYYGHHSDFLTNSDAQGLMEIVKEITAKKEYTNGILSGIVCVDQESAYFFILSDNFAVLKDTADSFSFDDATLKKMLDMITSKKVSPICWFRMRFGLHALDLLEISPEVQTKWEQIKSSGIIRNTMTDYQMYIDNILKNIAEQDKIQKRMDEIEKEQEEMMKQLIKQG